MSYFFKHILPWQVVPTISYLIYLILYTDLYKFVMGAIPAIFLISKIYYDKSKYVFTYFRKIHAWLKNPGVHWLCSYVYKLDNDISFHDLSKSYVKEIMILKIYLMLIISYYFLLIIEGYLFTMMMLNKKLK